VIRSVYVPRRVHDLVFTVSVERPGDPAGLGEKTAVVPAGSPATVSETLPTEPPVTDTPTVYLADFPRRTVTDEGLTDSAKSRAGTTRFVRFASHELRTPVTVGRGFAELIRDAQPGSQAAQDAIVVLEEFDNLERIAARLLTLVRMDESATVKPSVVALTALLERTVTRWRPAANRDWRLHPTSAAVVADRQRIETALDSLVENAVRYTEEGGRIALAAYPDEESVVIEVRDDGAGIPDEELPYVFESFHSGPSRGGTGIGLAIVKTIMEAHGGAVSAENLPGGGASFRLRLPVQGPPPPAAAEQDEPRHQGVAVSA
jgi:signal transduction histidine kinase